MHKTMLAAALLAGLATAAPAEDQARTGPASGMPPGMPQAAASLGIEADALLAALNEAGGPRANLTIVAAAPRHLRGDPARRAPPAAGL